MEWRLQQKQAADQDGMIAARTDGRGEGNSSHGMIEKHIQRAVVFCQKIPYVAFKM